MRRYQMYIGGKWLDPVGGEWFESENPYTAKPWALIPRGKAEDVDRAVGAAREAFTEEWSRLMPSARGRLLYKLGVRAPERKSLTKQPDRPVAPE